MVARGELWHLHTVRSHGSGLRDADVAGKRAVDSDTQARAILGTACVHHDVGPVGVGSLLARDCAFDANKTINIEFANTSVKKRRQHS